MRFSLHTVICCCVFTTMVPLIRGGPGDPHGPQKKRFREWLQSHMSRDPHIQLSAAKVQTSVESSQNKDGKTPLQSASFGADKRFRRSSGCQLSTCSIHDTLDKAQNLHKPCAPKHKLGKFGYGRRRRMADNPQLTVQTERPRTSSEAPQQDSSKENPCFQA
uniref:Adrenomedullin n=1 Tax=Fundulus heteroclitus TaxID=8078 RepID=A0A3Q2PXQ2_FUNHE